MVGDVVLNSPMNTNCGRRFVRVMAVSYVALSVLWAGEMVLRAEENVPATRTWKSVSGHSVEAELVSYSPVDVTLKLKNGKNTTIKLSKMSDVDIRYIKGFPGRQGQADKKNLPWVNVEAKVKKRSRMGRSGGLEMRTKSMEVILANRSKEDLELVVLYGFLVEKLSGKSAIARRTRTSELVQRGFQIRRISLKAQKDVDFVTETLYTAEDTIGRRKVGSKDQSFVVQVYWKGQFLNGWAADSNLNALANDATLLDKYQRR